MLSDEERKAIDYLQLCYDLSTITNESLSKSGIVLNLIEKQTKEIEEYKKQLDLDNECEIALNNKVMDLEKEIEELKQIKSKLDEKNIPIETLLAEFERLEDLEDDLTTVYLNGVYDGGKKVQDKIKAKIEEYDDKEMTVNLVNRSAGKTFQQAVRNEVRKVLQSLLEKE